MGHVTEEGRVVGFPIERVADCRHAAPEDLALCRRALERPRRLGVVRGDVNRHNFLIRDGRAVMIDCEEARRCGDERALGEELARLAEELRSTSGRGGVLVVSESDPVPGGEAVVSVGA